MFDMFTFEYILENLLNRISDPLDKREGSIIYNSLAPDAAELAEVYIMLSLLMDEAFVDTASNSNLDKKCKERGITRNPATNAIVKGEFNIDVPIGSRFSLEDTTYNYTVSEKISTGIFKLKCEDTGDISNKGMLIPILEIKGLESAKITEILIHGEEEEDDDSLRKRYERSLEGEAFGGNIADYKEKVNRLQDVGGVKVYPVWNGGGTVKLVIINSNYESPSETLVNDVQEKIDPTQNQGKGIGLAPIGHVVTVEGVASTIININTKLTLERGWTFEEIKPTLEKTIDDYFKELNSKWDSNDNIVVRISHIETKLLGITGIIDVQDTLLNGSSSNLIVDEDSIVKRGVISEQS